MANDVVYRGSRSPIMRPYYEFMHRHAAATHPGVQALADRQLTELLSSSPVPNPVRAAEGPVSQLVDLINEDRLAAMRSPGTVGPSGRKPRTRTVRAAAPQATARELQVA